MSDVVREGCECGDGPVGDGNEEEERRARGGGGDKCRFRAHSGLSDSGGERDRHKGVCSLEGVRGEQSGRVVHISGRSQLQRIKGLTKGNDSLNKDNTVLKVLRFSLFVIVAVLISCLLCLTVNRQDLDHVQQLREAQRTSQG